MTISQATVRSRRAQSKIGQLANANYQDRKRTLINRAPQSSQVGTIVADNAVNNTTYTWAINGIVMTFLSDASATKIEVAAGIVLAIDDEPLVRGAISAVSDGVDTVTLTGLWPGVAFTASDTDANLTTTEATVTAAEAASVAFGLGLVSQGYETGEANELGTAAASTLFNAQVVTITPTYVEDAEVGVIIVDRQSGHVIAHAVAVSDTSLADLLAELEAMLDIQLPANTVEVADPGGTSLTLTAEVAGYEFDAWVSLGDQGATVPTATRVYTTGPSIDTSLARAFAGVSLYSTDEENVTVAGNDVVYPPNAGVEALQDGYVWVSNSQAPSKGDDVYLDLAASTAKFYNTAGATRVQLPAALATWERTARSADGDELAMLRVNAS